MIRRPSRIRMFFAVVSVAACGAAYGCGGGDDEANDPDGGMPGDDGSTSNDAAVVGTEDGAAPGDGASPGDASDGSTEAAVDAGPLSAAYVDFAINHVLVTGQSNSVANGGDPPLSVAQPYTNLMFDTGVMPMTNCNGDGCMTYQTPAALVPLLENDQVFGYNVETSANGIADEISKLAHDRYQFGVRPGYPAKHDVLVSNHGRSGNTYWCLRKGFCSYNLARGHTSPFGQGMSEVTSAKALAAGKTHVVRAVVAVHGESDHYSYVLGTQEFPLDGTDGTPGKIKNYEDALLEWQQDYQTSVKAITGQTQNVPLLISGLSGFTTTRTSQVLQWQLDAHIAAPGKVVYVTSGYAFSVRNDCLHYDNHGYRRLGEYFAKVYAKIVFGGETWEPVRPKLIARAGNVVTVKYYVPAPPLVIDTVHVTNPNAAGEPAPFDLGKLGFDFVDNGTLVAISSVVVSAADTVTITLAAQPSGTNMRLRYAQNQDTNPATRCIGPGTVFRGGARGNLRDSDATPSQYGYDLWNWGVSFDSAVP
jgi:hypothetical protein